MLILEKFSGEIPDTNALHWNLKEFNDDDGETVLMCGYDTTQEKSFHDSTEAYKRKILFNNWSPCEFSSLKDHFGLNAFQYDQRFNEVYTICPYTAEWMNSMYGHEKYKSIFYPFNKNIIPKNQEKIYDVIYHGGIHGQDHVDCLKSMSKFNYLYLTMTHHINQMTINCLPYATTVNVPFQEKIDFVAQSRVSVSYNLLYDVERHINAIQTYNSWEQNKAHGEVGKQNIRPQFKTRMHEGAISKTLNVVKRDPWNLAELYYEPEKEFLYFDTHKELELIIEDAKNNWDKYEPIVERAYRRAMNYTTDKFVDVVKSGQSWEGYE